MKTVVSLQELADIDIRPSKLFVEFRELTRQSAAALARGRLTPVPCPACGSDNSRAAFDRVGLAYRECERCRTLFISPRPTSDAVAEYYRSSPAAVFWRERVMPETLVARREKLAVPRGEWVVEGLAEHRHEATDGVDVSPAGALTVESLPAMRGVRVISVPAVAGGVPAVGSADFVTAFETLDRMVDVPDFVSQLRRTLRPEGLLFLTTPTISGFDLQALWDRSPAILPPDRLNLLSVDGLARLFAPPDWDLIELSTPGMFDVENVRHAIEQDPDAEWPRALRLLIEGSDASRLELQGYLQRHRLTSFARLVVRRTAREGSDTDARR